MHLHHLIAVVIAGWGICPGTDAAGEGPGTESQNARVAAGETTVVEATPRSMRAEIAAGWHQRFPAFKPSKPDATVPDPTDVVKLPPFLVRAPAVKTPTEETVVSVPMPVASVVDYKAFLQRDAKRQDMMNDYLHLADITELSGDPALAKKLRREIYRSLGRSLSPLESAMDHSANGGRY